VHRQGRSGVQQDGVAHRPLLAGQQPAHHLRVVRRVLAAQSLGGPRGDSERSRVDGVLAGDVALDVREVAGFVAPNPGGVGPMTRAMLLTNVVEAAERAAAS